jgi:secreted Zn-dependent insulinase-like peptidase
MGYMAELAGTSLSLTVNTEYLKLNYFAYNDNIEAYLAEVFGSLQDFKTDEYFFNDLKQSRLRNMKNSLFQEPY